MSKIKNVKLVIFIGMLVILYFVLFKNSNFINFNKGMRTLYIFDSSRLTEADMKSINADIFSYNPSLDKFKITKYPTYILVRTSSQDILLITNELSDIKQFK